MTRKTLLAFAALFTSIGVAGAVMQTALRPAHVGDVTGAGTVVPTGEFIKDTGITVAFNGRPVDLVASPDGRFAFVKENRGVTVIDLNEGKVIQELAVAGGASLTGLALSPDGTQLFDTDAAKGLHILSVSQGHLAESSKVEFAPAPLGGAPYPCGVAVEVSGKRAWVCLNRSNALAAVDVNSQKVSHLIPVGVAPFAVRLSADGRTAYVTCWSARPVTGQAVADSSGTSVPVDRRGIGLGGELCVVDLAAQRVTATIPVASQPTDVQLYGNRAYVACSNGDEVDEIDLGRRVVVHRIPIGKTGRGAAPNALAVGRSGSLYIAAGGESQIYRLNLAAGETMPNASIQSNWYPSAIGFSGSRLVIANAKGHGSRWSVDTAKGKSAYSFEGTVSIIEPSWVPASNTPATIRTSHSRRPRPIPALVGDPSVFHHVVYVIKENRTYDQVLGDLPAGNGRAEMAIFGSTVTPNAHELASQFVLLDNFYCNGVNSADGHAWATEGNATTYFERAFGGWTRSYPFGDDPLATSNTGYLWDNALDHRRSYRNYGEFDYAELPAKATWTTVYQDYLRGKNDAFKQKIGVARVREHSNHDFPGWNLSIPDVLRADRFVQEFQRMDVKGQVPDLITLYLPQDHTSGQSAGMPTPRAQVADNDLALGRVVEAISKSAAWKDTCIFVVEDDAQDGLDHVDGHRSPCLVISPYTKRHAVVSDFFNQTSVLHSIERILRLPPMNRFDANAPTMENCFALRPNFTPYSALPNQIPLDEMNGRDLKAQKLSLARPDDADEDELNAQILRSVHQGHALPHNR